ncbi:MAG: autotransporter-associated beta strand repeat-containing protein [Verrucomicrobiota bacterium]
MADNTSSLALVKVGTGTLTLTGNNTFSGGTIVSNGTLLLQGTIANIGSGSVAVRSGARFGGSGNVSGAITVDAGGTVRAAGGIGAPPLNVGILTLGNGPTEVTTSEVDAFLNGKIICLAGLTVNGTNVVNITGAVPPVGVYDLITYTGAIGGSGFAGFKLGALPPGVVANLQDSGTAIQLNVTQTGEAGVWVGNVLSQWNLAGGLEWKGATSGNPQAYLNLYPVNFNDSAANFTVTITEDVTPAIVNLNHATDYTFTGAGGIIGTAGLTKDGPGKLTIANNNSYSGGTFITNGTVQLGNGGTSGSIASPVNNDGVLVFNRSDAITFSGINGAGSIEQRGTGITTVGGANSYTGLAIIASGTLVAGSGSALGVTNSGTVISNAATLDVNSQSLGAEPISAQGAGVGGAGAIVNNGPGDQTTATRYVTLDGPTTFGGARRWDIRVPTVANDPNGGNDAFLHGNGYNLTKVSSNVVAFISAGDTALGDVDIQGGTLTFSRSTYMGNPSKKITVRPGATLQLHRTSEFVNNILDKVVSLTNAVFAIESNGLTNNQFAGPVTLSDSNVINLPAATGLILTGPVNGGGSATVIGPGTLVVSGNANHTGGTTVNGAVLQVDGTLGDIAQPLTIISPATIGGNGTIKSAVTVPSGSVLSPGAHSSVSVPGTTLGGLTINNTLILQAGCSNIFEINKDAGTNDTVRGLTSVTMAGTLFLQNVGSTSYAPGDSFKLFAAGSYSGGFASIVPATPAAGLIWLTNSLTTSGTLGVAVLPNPIPLKVFSSSSLISNEVNVIFSAEVDPSTSQNPANYTISTGQGVTGATLRNGTNVVLTLDSPITSLAYTVNVKSVQDLAYIPNVVATTNVPGTALGFQESVSVLVTNGSAFAYGTNHQIKVYSDGVDIFGTQDEFQFVYKNIEGDFDFSVRLESLLITDPAAKAGIMAREITDPSGVRFDDRHFHSAAFTTDVTRNNNFVQYRDENPNIVAGAVTTAPAAPRPPAFYPNNWLRLKRTGAVFQGYSGPDGLNWTPMSAIDTSTNVSGPFPSLLRVGLAVTSHNRAQTTEAVFSDFGVAKEAVPLTASLSGNNVVVTWPAGTGTTLQATPSLSSPVIWTNVPGSELTSQAVFPISGGNSFFRLVK